MPRKRWNLVCCPGRTEVVGRVITNLTEVEEKKKRTSETDKKWFHEVPRKHQSDMQQDSRLHDCKYGEPVLQLQMNCVPNRMNKTGWEWMKGVNKRQQISIKDDSMSGYHVIIIILHPGTAQLMIIILASMFPLSLWLKCVFIASYGIQ